MEASRTFDILVAGEINPDLILSGNVIPEFNQTEKLVDSAALTIGSSSAIFACGAARLGLRVGFVGVCGDDPFGHFMLDELQSRNVDIRNSFVRKGEKTGLSVILNQEADRAILTYPGLINALEAADISDILLRQARHLHVGSYFLQTGLQPALPALFQRAHAAGTTTSLDTNYDPTETWEGFDSLLSDTDVFLPNELEALAIARSENIESACEQLARKSSVVAVKLGAYGALACDGKEMLRTSSIPAQVADTVGAGDSFDAGFLFGYLGGWALDRSLKLACACGAMSTQKTGGTDGQPTLDEAMKYVS